MEFSIARHGILPFAIGFVTGSTGSFAYHAYNLHRENKEFAAQGKVPLHQGENINLAATMIKKWKQLTKSD